MFTPKQIMKHILDRYMLPYVVSQAVRQAEDNLVHHLAADQLFYDVANFIVYNQVPGDYLEFGVYEGNGFAQMYKFLAFQWRTYQSHAEKFGHDIDAAYWANKRFFAFDSFEGLPATVSADTPSHYSKGTYKAPLDSFRANIKARGVDMSRVITVPGWFDKTLTEELKSRHNLTRASAIFIDCDMYESSIPIFSFITSLIQDGTVIIIDDYFRYKGNPGRGVQKGFREWLGRSAHIGTSELTRCSANRLAFVCHIAGDKKHLQP